MIGVLLLAVLIAKTAVGQVNVTTARYDNARTSQNVNEAVLTTQNVNSQQFGRVFSHTVDGLIYTQPLYLANVMIPGKNGPVKHNVIYVATENDNGSNLYPLWKVSLGTSVVVPNSYFGNRYGPYTNIYPEIGITGTPVI